MNNKIPCKILDTLAERGIGSSSYMGPGFSRFHYSPFSRRTEVQYIPTSPQLSPFIPKRLGSDQAILQLGKA
jgi:hypothetical protein